MMWIRQPNATLLFNETDTDSSPYLPASTTRTSKLVQKQPTFQNGWTTDASGPNRLTISRAPQGWVQVTGILTQANNTLRANATAVFQLPQDMSPIGGGTTGFPSNPLEHHYPVDGKNNGSGWVAIITIGADGVARCYNLDSAAGSQSYYLQAVFNRFAESGKYAGTGGT